jgi:branched-chain amino acid transport system permease protein
MMKSFWRSPLPILAFTVAYAALAVVVRDSYYQLVLTLILVWALMGLSWNIISGYTGLVSFGHAAFFGLGAYTTALCHIKLGVTPWISIPIAGGFGAAAGLLIGSTTFRLRGHYFGLAMLAYPLALLYVFEWLGYQELTMPMERSSGTAFMQFGDGRVYTLIALGLLSIVAGLTWIIEHTRFGMALHAIKQDEPAAEAAGVDTLRWKLLAISLSGAVAGAVGGFYAVVLLVITPAAVFGMLVSAQALVIAMFGGVGTFWGPIIGSLTLVPMGEILQAELGARIPGIQGVIYGVAIIAISIAAPEGLFWKFRDFFRTASSRKRTHTPPPSTTIESNVTAFAVQERRRPPPEAAEVILEVRGLSKSFAGLRAVENVSFSVRKGTVLGIIGPNGAGKTTVFNLLNGFIRPDKGVVMLGGVNVAGEKPHVVCRAGIGRTFQVMRPFQRMTVAENVRVGAYVQARTEDDATKLAQQAVARVGLSSVADELASNLSTRELRLMEIARAIAGQPRILLLDETLAGLGHQESEQVVSVVRRIAAEGITVVIIEHTMREMVRLVDRFLVLDHGQVLIEDVPENVTRNAQVVEAYLGRKWSAANAGN